MKLFPGKFVGPMILVRGLGAWGAHRVGASQTTLVNEPFGLSRVGFLFDPVIVPGDHSVQRAPAVRRRALVRDEGQSISRIWQRHLSRDDPVRRPDHLA